jgi:hypothetical protein
VRVEAIDSDRLWSTAVIGNSGGLLEHISQAIMHHRVNSTIHLVSALYWALGTALGIFVGLAPFFSPQAFRVWISAGIGLAGLDLLAGAKQWRSPTKGRVLSIVLHLVVSILIVSLVTFEYLQAKPKSFPVWFRRDNYWFVAALALVRLCVGNALLLGNKDAH